MIYDDIIIIMSLLFFALFITGWIAHWGWTRLAAAASSRQDRADELVAELLIVEEERDRAIAERRELEIALRGEAESNEQLLQTKLREREAELEAAMDGLRAARQELENLRP